MCSGTANVVSHVYMLVWLVVFAVPTLFLFNHKTDDLPDSVGFFTCVVFTAGYGVVMVCLRLLLGWCKLTRWVANILLFVYVIALLLIAAYSGYFAYIFIYPFFDAEGFDGWYDNIGVELGRDKDTVYVWYIIGGVSSCLLSLFAGIMCFSAWGILREGHKERSAAAAYSGAKNRREEYEPLVGGRPVERTGERGMAYA
mmetsp:Transcript_17336/g.55185  ORF Transcript_17336/g.55185 Transcript_17336/m.55185 type:complete len:199 (+) Transcript_17336:157-753(+)